MTVTVVGVGAGCALGAAARGAVDEADLVVGAAANIELAGADRAVEWIELGPVVPAIERLRSHHGKAVVVAAGDPGFFGIARALREAGLDPTVLPVASSVAMVAAHAGVPWDAAVVVSAHGRDLEPALNACRAFPAVAVLTGPGAGPVEIARGLDGRERDLVVAERLGHADERVTRQAANVVAKAEPGEFADPNVVLCLRPGLGSAVRADNQPAAAPPGGWALDESQYAHRHSMITKAEIRAYIVARLRPRLGRSVWDIGAGSGSIGIECASLGAAVTCVEQDPASCSAIAANSERHEVDVRIVTGSAPDVLDGLGAPDAVFVGGGGADVIAWATAARVPTLVAAYAALDRALAAHRHLTDAGYLVGGTQISAARLADLPGGSLRLAAINPVIVVEAEAVAQ